MEFFTHLNYVSFLLYASLFFFLNFIILFFINPIKNFFFFQIRMCVLQIRSLLYLCIVRAQSDLTNLAHLVQT